MCGGQQAVLKVVVFLLHTSFVFLHVISVPHQMFPLLFYLNCRFWYLSIVSCYRNTSGRKCEWQSSEDSGLVINYDIWLVNGNPSFRGQNPFEHQFSFEFHDVFEIHMIALILCIAIFLLWLYAFSTQRHIVTELFTACLCGEMLSISLNLIHVSIFAYNGVGAEWLGKVGTLLDLATQCVFMLVLLLLAKGLGITSEHFKWKSVIFSLWAAYTLLNIFLYVWNLVSKQLVQSPFSSLVQSTISLLVQSQQLVYNFSQQLVHKFSQQLVY